MKRLRRFQSCCGLGEVAVDTSPGIVDLGTRCPGLHAALVDRLLDDGTPPVLECHEHLPVFVAFEHWRGAIIKEAIYQRRMQTGAPRAEVDDARRGVDSHLAEATARLETA